MTLSFDALAEQFDDQRGLPANALRHLVAFVDGIARGRTLTVVEPGIGTGRISLPLAAAGHRIVGVDISRPMLDACARKAATLRVEERVTLIEGDATMIPCKDDSCDLGVFASLLYLLRGWEDVLDELARIVRPGGVVVWIRERTERGDALALWDTGWRTRVEAAGFHHQAASPTEDEILAALSRRWPDVMTEPLASWTFGQSVGRARDGYGERLRSLYPQIPDDTWSVMVQDFLHWAETSFPDPEGRLDGQVMLEAIVAWT
jgi:ubiquinone/menaquinone biosynthesis C-methylase UbiE